MAMRSKFKKWISDHFVLLLPNVKNQMKVGWNAAIAEAVKIADGWDRPTGHEDLPLDIRDAINRLKED